MPHCSANRRAGVWSGSCNEPPVPFRKTEPTEGSELLDAPVDPRGLIKSMVVVPASAEGRTDADSEFDAAVVLVEAEGNDSLRWDSRMYVEAKNRRRKAKNKEQGVCLFMIHRPKSSRELA